MGFNCAKKIIIPANGNLFVLEQHNYALPYLNQLIKNVWLYPVKRNNWTMVVQCRF